MNLSISDILETTRSHNVGVDERFYQHFSTFSLHKKSLIPCTSSLYVEPRLGERQMDMFARQTMVIAGLSFHSEMLQKMKESYWGLGRTFPKSHFSLGKSFLYRTWVFLPLRASTSPPFCPFTQYFEVAL
jgi:hypothetical protein